MNFYNWLLQIGKSERTAKSYSGALSGVMSEWAIDAGFSKRRLDGIESIKELDAVAEALKGLDIYQARNTKGKNMYGSALNAYAKYLADAYTDSVQNDIQAVLDDETIQTTEKNRLVSARVGQGKYRKHLIDFWKGCAVTGFRDTRLLIASHIKPWRDSNNQEKLDPFNGLLLLPNLDRVFDLGFVSFADDGDIIISSKLENRGVLGIESDMRVEFDERHGGYMAYHRDAVFEKHLI